MLFLSRQRHFYPSDIVAKFIGVLVLAFAWLEGGFVVLLEGKKGAIRHFHRLRLKWNVAICDYKVRTRSLTAPISRISKQILIANGLALSS